jgi:hypothetical protein
MVPNTRRAFLGEIGRGMLLAGLGTSLAVDLGLSSVQAAEAEGDQLLSFGKMEPLVALMQETPPARLVELLVEKVKEGTGLQTLVAAGALANARTFGGQDYVGFHTFMALAPAYRMAQEFPTLEQPLPVLKVLYRNANRIQEFGGRKNEILHPVAAAGDSAAGSKGEPNGEQLREVCRSGDIERADQTFAGLASGPVGEAFNHLQFAVQDEVDVHRIVLAWRAWDSLDIVGQQWAQCLLRQSVRYCANIERQMIDRNRTRSPIRSVLPSLLDQYQLLGRTLGTKPGEDAWLHQLATTIFRGTRDQAADAAAQALAEGFSSEAVGEAISLAANMLVLHDPGRPEAWSSKEKPVGSCHGDSVGVHASDAANAWRNTARVSNPRNTVASLIVGAYHTGGQSDRSTSQPYPFAEHFAEVKTSDPAELLRDAGTAIEAKDQFRAAALVSKYGQGGHPAGPVFEMLLRYSASEDGALHAEKYYSTVRAEFADTRPAFRWGQLVALARVAASEYGFRSPGYDEAKRLLNV